MTQDPAKRARRVSVSMNTARLVPWLTLTWSAVILSACADPVDPPAPPDDPGFYRFYVYEYVGRQLNIFEGPSYSTSDSVMARLTLQVPVQPAQVLVDVRQSLGFSLSMADGHQTLEDTTMVFVEALLSTDGSGTVVPPWSLIINCCPIPNNGIATLHWADVRGVSDEGRLSAPTVQNPDLPADFGRNLRNPGNWVSFWDSVPLGAGNLVAGPRPRGRRERL